MCICALLHFVLNGQILCFMEHYSYDIGEKTMSRVEILEVFLTRIVRRLKSKIGPGTIKPHNQWPNLSEAKLIIACGYVHESLLIKTAFSLLNNNTRINFYGYCRSND